MDINNNFKILKRPGSRDFAHQLYVLHVAPFERVTLMPGVRLLCCANNRHLRSCSACNQEIWNLTKQLCPVSLLQVKMVILLPYEMAGKAR